MTRRNPVRGTVKSRLNTPIARRVARVVIEWRTVDGRTGGLYGRIRRAKIIDGADYEGTTHTDKQIAGAQRLTRGMQLKQAEQVPSWEYVDERIQEGSDRVRKTFGWSTRHTTRMRHETTGTQ